ncbi:cytochrome P450 [Penicillium nucicola]|uniref:cytochrome P450 n=1 Tax=Penicillium nucicola TaxID=1850975 RepID=UPI002545BD80|nr:cytochrome P450 [Penicillium nucicola]KAJ5754144.1 cytochrome P450 [Penicillium nucicola]
MLAPEGIAVVVGLLAHQLIFINGEWHLRGPSVVVFHIIFGIILYSAVLFLRPDSRKSNVNRVTLSILIYHISLFSSITIYRIFFHRLRRFPGPRLAACTKLWHVWKCRDSRGHLVLQAWYEEYGPFVRTGPSETTIFHPEAYEAMDGAHNRNTRSDWYDLLYPRISSIFTRDKKLHNERRKMWEQALSTQSLQQYHRRVIEKVHTLENLIAAEVSTPVLVNDLMYFFAFDSMGDFAFSEDFGMMRTKQWHSSIAMLRSALTLLGPFSPAIWIPRLGFAFIPGLWKVRHWFYMLQFCDECIARRVKKVLPDRDIASWFIEDHEKHGSDPTRAQWLSGDTATLVVAGSLTLLIYFLARFPNHAERVNNELQDINIEDPVILSTLPHLNGTINEAMRLLPAVPTFSSRVTPPEGLVIDGKFIPGGTKICAPRYTIGRRADFIPFYHIVQREADRPPVTSAFINPHSFIPERWYSRPELIRDKRAFAPFGIGKMLPKVFDDSEGHMHRPFWRTSCVGRHLALAQIRLVAAALVSKYQIKFAPGAGLGEAVERDMRDQLTAQPGACWVVFHPR